MGGAGKKRKPTKMVPERRVMKLADLKPAPYNPRTMSEYAFKGLAKSIEQFGLVEPIILNERSGNVVGGHQRLKVLESMSVTETEVVVVDLAEEEERTLNITLNNRLVMGEFTVDALPPIDDILNSVPELAIDLRLPELSLDIETALYKEEQATTTEPPALESLGKRNGQPSMSVRCPECGAQFELAEGVG